MIRLTKSQVLLIHDQLIAETGGSSGLRDEGMLDSALSAPFQTFGGEDVYPSLQQKAARLCFGLVKNHPFVGGFCHATCHHASHGFLRGTKNKETSGSHRCDHRLLPVA